MSRLPKSRLFMSRLRRKLLVSGLSLLGLAVVVDVGLTRFAFEEGLFRGRPLPPFGAINHPRQAWWLARHQESLASGEESAAPGVFDAELGWSYRPGSATGEGRYHLNSDGARGLREYAGATPAGATRLLCVGDSFTYGSEVDDDATWEAQLEADDPAVEALNFGVASYGTDQALLRYRRVAPRFEHDVACMGILVENIGRNVNRYRPIYYPSAGSPGVKPRFVLVDGELALVPQPFATRRALVEAIADGSVLERTREHEYWSDASDLGPLRHSSLARLAAAWFAYSRRQPARLWAAPRAEPARVTLALLERFHAEATAGGAGRTLVLVFPRQAELDEYARAGSRYWQPLLDGLAERGIAHLDLAEVLLEPYRRSRAAPDEPSLYVGGHLSRAGNALVAARLARWLASGE